MATPKCRYFGTCGGCELQHLDYSMQLENKKAAVSRITGCMDVRVFSGPEYNYRSRMDFVFFHGGVGLRKKESWQKVVDIESCAISDPRINTLLGEIRKHFSSADSFDVRKKTGTFRYAIIRVSSEAATVSFILNSDSQGIKGAIAQVGGFSKVTSADSVIVAYVPPDRDAAISDDFFIVKGTDALVEHIQGKAISYSCQGFFQNNTPVSGMMLEHSREILSKYNTKGATLLDLYGGVGTFGIASAGLFSKVLVIENAKGSIEAAKRNMQDNGVMNAEAMLLDAKYIHRLELGSDVFVITDPPRCGMHERAIQHLNKIKPKAIIYISCNIQQLGKDLKKLKGYSVKSAALFDMFPQTNHIEAMVELAAD